MNFANEIRAEIIKKPLKEVADKRAFLAGLFRGAGTLFEENDRLGLFFSLRTEEEAFVVSNYLEDVYGYSVREIEIKEDKLNRRDKYTITVSGEKAAYIFLDLEIIVEKDGFRQVNLNLFGDLNEQESCLKAFLRGLFIGAGTCTVPSGKRDGSSGYHLSIYFSHLAPAEQTCQTLFSHGVVSKVMKTKNGYSVYIKSGEEISNFVALIGAPVCVLKITDLIVEREVVNQTNRKKNCDMGNINRQIDASEKQLSAIETIEKAGVLKTLKADLKETAILRKNNPADTMTELAERLHVTKSCLNHRLRKIVSIAKEIQGEKDV